MECRIKILFKQDPLGLIWKNKIC